MISAAILSLLTLTSCYGTDLGGEPQELTTVNVAVKMANISQEALPKGVTIDFYPHDVEGYGVKRFSVSPNNTSEVRITPGTYDIVAYTSESGATQISGGKTFSGLIASTSEGTIPCKATSRSNETVSNCPSTLYKAVYRDVRISADNQVFAVELEEVTKNYSIEVDNVAEASEITKISASLSGMSGSMNISTGELGEEEVTLPLDCSLKDGKISIRFSTFGFRSSKKHENILSVYAWMKDGSRWCYSVDVTSQVENGGKTGDVSVKIDEISFRKSLRMEDPERFVMVVGDWNIVDIEVAINTDKKK